ncbi:MAG: phosphotransferase family protein [Planctomycetota bacterium]|jgi:aminoglycoside phosphotransferase (APT) family kinase protein
MTSPGPRIAEGRTAEVYAWGEGQVLKLFRDWFPPDAVEHEARVARAVHAKGLAVPAAGEVVEVDGHRGLVYERVDGPAMWEWLQSRLWAKPWKLLCVPRLLAQLHADMHATVVPGLPSQRRRLIEKIEAAAALPAQLQDAALDSLGRMPDGDRLCHGDYHPGNILMAAGGPVIIDWIDATSGNPLADVARTYVIMSEATAPGSRLSWWRRLTICWLCRAYRRRYFQLRPGDREELIAWRPIVAAARLSEDIPQSREWLLNLAESGLP